MPPCPGGGWQRHGAASVPSPAAAARLPVQVVEPGGSPRHLEAAVSFSPAPAWRTPPRHSSSVAAVSSYAASPSRWWTTTPRRATSRGAAAVISSPVTAEATRWVAAPRRATSRGAATVPPPPAAAAQGVDVDATPRHLEGRVWVRERDSGKEEKIKWGVPFWGPILRVFVPGRARA